MAVFFTSNPEVGEGGGEGFHAKFRERQKVRTFLHTVKGELIKKVRTFLHKGELITGKVLLVPFL